MQVIGETCERCGSRVLELSFDKLARKDICPQCMNYLEVRRASLRSRLNREKRSEGTGKNVP
jgi:hypothetical protein